MFTLRPEGQGGIRQAVQMGKGSQVQGIEIWQGQRLEKPQRGQRWWGGWPGRAGRGCITYTQDFGVDTEEGEGKHER